MDWSKIVQGGSEDISSLLQEHTEIIEERYKSAKKDKGVDINLKLVVTPGKDNTVLVKSGISFTTQRVKAEKERTVTDQGELFEGKESQEEEPE